MAKKVMQHNGAIMQKLLDFVEEHIMVENFGLIPDGLDGMNQQPHPLLIESLKEFLRVSMVNSSRQQQCV